MTKTIWTTGWVRGLAVAALLLSSSTQSLANPNREPPPGEAGPAEGDGSDAAAAGAGLEDVLAGRAAIDAGDYPDAIKHLLNAVAVELTNAEAYNLLGYANRKQQNFDQALGYYRRALEINPEHTGAHHYIGETYLEIGDQAAAEQHLRSLDLICLFGCDDFDQLAQALAQYRANHSS